MPKRRHKRGTKSPLDILLQKEEAKGRLHDLFQGRQTLKSLRAAASRADRDLRAGRVAAVAPSWMSVGTSWQTNYWVPAVTMATTPVAPTGWVDPWPTYNYSITTAGPTTLLHPNDYSWLTQNTIATTQWVTTPQIIRDGQVWANEEEYEASVALEANSLYDEAGNLQRSVFDAWWQEARADRLMQRREREQAWKNWLRYDFAPERKFVRKWNQLREDFRLRPGADDLLIERGLIRMRYDAGNRNCYDQALDMSRPDPPERREGDQIVWYRVEIREAVGVLGGGPWAKLIKGRPSRAEIREYRRVVARQRELEGARLEMQRLAAEEQARIQAEARTRARDLLLDVLTDAQRAELEEHDYFHVQVEDRRYRIRAGAGRSGVGVYLMEGDRTAVSYCIHHYGGNEPSEDTNVAQLLMLMNDEAEFLRVANATHHRPMPVQALAA